MRRSLLLLAVLACAASVALAQTNPLYVTQDVPTIPAAPLATCTGGPAMLPSEIYFYDPGALPVYVCALGPVPGDAHVDAIHKLDTPGDFLFSLEEPSNLAGFLLPGGSTAMPGDVIHFDSSTATFNLCFVAASVGIPPERNVDAIYRMGGDTGDLVVSFDVPTILAPFPPFEPADLVDVVPSAAAICPAAWGLAAVNPIFDASAAGAGIPISRNAIGADDAPGAFLLSFDVPTNVAPPALPTVVPGQVVSFSAGLYALFETKVGWPITSQDDFSCLANPGRIPPTLMVDKTGLLDVSPIILAWTASCSPDGATDYGIYEGMLGAWYSHTSAAIDDCNDAGGDLTETVTPIAGDTYYLIVPHNDREEGSYGTCSPAAACGAGNERPVGGAVCEPQMISVCPPP